MTKIKKSVRFESHNYDFIQNIADVGFYDDNRNEGNFSEALNFLIYLLRERTPLSGTFKFFEYKARYDRGERSKEVLKGKRDFEALILFMKNSTE